MRFSCLDRPNFRIADNSRINDNKHVSRHRSGTGWNAPVKIRFPRNTTRRLSPRFRKFAESRGFRLVLIHKRTSLRSHGNTIRTGA